MAQKNSPTLLPNGLYRATIPLSFETVCCEKDLNQVELKELFFAIWAIRLETGSSRPSEIQILISNNVWITDTWEHELE